MQEIKKWILGKPFLIALLAPQLAVTARDIHEAFQHIKQRRIMEHQFPLPSLTAWYALYRSHRKPLNFLRKIFANFSIFEAESIEFGEDVLEGARQLGSNKQVEIPMPSPEDIEQIKSTMENILAESFQDIKNDISPPPVDPSIKDQMLTLLQDMSLESSFFILVTVPCWLVYRMPPTRLYRKARQGDYKALKRLLTLDPLMLHNPAIGQKIQKLRFNHKITKYEKLLEAPIKNPHVNITAQQMKYALGGLLSAFGKILKPVTKQSLSAATIHKLFDAVAQDFDGVLTDPDLPENEDSFARAIFRYRDEWLKAFKPDTKKSY